MDQQARFIDFINDLKASGHDSVAIFTHGGILAQALVTLRGMTPQEVFADAPVYGAIIEINID